MSNAIFIQDSHFQMSSMNGITDLIRKKYDIKTT